jgi:exosome complex component RRP41
MKRVGNRKPGELRPVEIEAGIIPNADGSALVRLGKTTAIAAVYGPRPVHPKWKQRSDRGILNCVYSMLPFSTNERVRPGPSRRSNEISKVTSDALAPAIYLEEYPKSAIDVYINIIQAEAGTRTAGVNAASVALADAGISMRGLVSSAAAGLIDKTCVLDLEGKEEDASKCDIPVAYMPKEKKVTLLQMDGDLTPKEATDIINLAIKGCEELYKKQVDALKRRWEK